MVEVNSSEMQPEGNLSFDPVWYVFLLRQLSFGYGSLVSVISFDGFIGMVQIQTKDFLSCFDLREVEWLLLLTIQSSHSWKTMLFQLCVHVLIFVMLAFFY